MTGRIALFASFLSISSVAFAATSGAILVRQACGADAAAIQATVDQFRTDLGALNPNNGASFPSGRREINWDGVPDAFSAPNNLPANFFNVNSPRGVVFSTPGTGFQVSANTGGATPVRFGNINPTYLTTFTTFSPQRLFAALGSNVLDVDFFVAGTNSAATTLGFGAVFTDVDVASATSIQFFNALDVSIVTLPLASAASGGLCFLGAFFGPGSPIVGRVRITSGNTALGPDDAPPATDVVAMDDFIYGEPQGVGTPTPTATPTSTATPTATLTSVPPSATATVVGGGGGPAPGIPTLSGGTLALLAATLAAVALLLMRRG